MPLFNVVRIWRGFARQHVWVEADDENEARKILDEDPQIRGLTFERPDTVHSEKIEPANYASAEDQADVWIVKKGE